MQLGSGVQGVEHDVGHGQQLRKTRVEGLDGGEVDLRHLVGEDVAPVRGEDFVVGVAGAVRPGAYRRELDVGAVEQRQHVVLGEGLSSDHEFLVCFLAVQAGYGVQHAGQRLTDHTHVERGEGLAHHQRVGIVDDGLNDHPEKYQESLAGAGSAVKQNFRELSGVEQVIHFYLLGVQGYVQPYFHQVLSSETITSSLSSPAPAAESIFCCFSCMTMVSLASAM